MCVHLTNQMPLLELATCVADEQGCQEEGKEAAQSYNAADRDP